MNKPPQPITGPTSVPNPAPSPGLTQVRAAVLIKLFCGMLLLHPALSFSCVFPLSRRPMAQGNPLLLFLPPLHLHKWILHHSQDRYGCASRRNFLFTLSVICGVPPLPQIRHPPHIFPSHKYFRHCCFCFKALAEYVCVCGKACLLSFSLMSTLTSSLSLAVLPVCCRSSYFTPTGTNTPHCFLHMEKKGFRATCEN